MLSRVLYLLLFCVGLALLVAGCLDDLPYEAPLPDAGSTAPHGISAAVAQMRPSSPQAVVDAGPVPDLLPPPAPDLAPADLAGLTDCYGKAYCDTATMFCLRFFDGSPGKPGPEKLAPSCYAPNDPCPNGTLDCACVLKDAVLGPSCAECFDNKDGTITCYAQ